MGDVYFNEFEPFAAEFIKAYMSTSIPPRP